MSGHAQEPWWSDPARRTVVAAPVCAPLLAGWALLRNDPFGWLAFALYGLLAALQLGCRRRGHAQVNDLAAARRRCWVALGSLPSPGWVVLPDRRVPGCALAVFDIVVGPPGVVLVTPFVEEAPGSSDWRRQRVREAARLQVALATELGRPVAQVQAVAAGAAGWPRHGRMTLDGLVMCSVDQLADCVSHLPVSLSPAAVAFLGEVVDQACPPATPISPRAPRAVR